MRTPIGSCCRTSLVIFIAVGAHVLAADEPPPSGKGSIKGEVVYGGPAANIKLTLTGPVDKEEKSNAQGQFVFKDLPPGAYKLEANGIAKNNRRKGSAEVTVPDSSEAVQVKIKLE